MATQFKEGFYAGRITSRWGLGKSKDKGTPCIQWWVTPTHRKEMGKLVPMETSGERTVIRYLTEGTIDSVIKELRSFGYDYDSFDQIDPEHAEAFDFEGIEVELRCKHETYEGEARERWEFAMLGGGSFVKPIERSDVSKLNTLFGKHLKGGKAPPPANSGIPAKPVRTQTEVEAEEVF